MRDQPLNPTGRPARGPSSMDRSSAAGCTTTRDASGPGTSHRSWPRPGSAARDRRPARPRPRPGRPSACAPGPRSVRPGVGDPGVLRLPLVSGVMRAPVGVTRSTGGAVAAASSARLQAVMLEKRSPGRLDSARRSTASTSGGRVGTRSISGAGVRVHDVVEQRRDLLVVEGRAPAQHLPGDAGQRPLIGAVVDRGQAPAGLLGRHVVGRAHQRRGLGQLGVGVLAPWRCRSRRP